MTKAKQGDLLFIKDPINNKKRPYMCIHVFTNKANVPYDWLIIPITSKVSVGFKNLIKITHPKLSLASYAKISNIESISWNDEIEVAKTSFSLQSVRDVTSKLQNILNSYR